MKIIRKNDEVVYIPSANERNDHIAVKFNNTPINKIYTIKNLKEIFNSNTSLDAKKRTFYNKEFTKWARWIINEYGSKDSVKVDDNVVIIGYTKIEKSSQHDNNETQQIKSDGGKSLYYHKQIPDWMMKHIKEKGNVIEVEDIIRLFFNNDFDFGTAFKSLVRMYAATNGGGKAGNNVDYEHNKVVYSLNKAFNDYKDMNEK